MEDGNLHERDIITRLLWQEYEVVNYGDKQRRVTTKVKTVNWSGRSDAYIKLDGQSYGLEIKALRAEAFEKYIQGASEVKSGRYIGDASLLMERPWPMMGQVQLYLHSDLSKFMGIDQYILIMKNKNTAELAEFQIDKQPEYLEYLHDRWSNFWSLVTKKKLPERAFSSDSVECQYCPFRLRCWGNEFELRPETLELNEDEELQEVVKIWREGRSLEKSSAVRIEYSKLKFANRFEEIGVDKLIVDDFQVSLSRVTSKRLSNERATNLLYYMVREGYIDRETVDSCFDTGESIRITPRDKKK
jgi:hypothetical protein